MCDMYTSPVSYNGEEVGDDQSLWNSQETIEEREDKVILETEITLRTGPNITMKIHEESRPESEASEEESSKKQGVLKVLNDDSESDFYEEPPRSPRKVRFGGESFKLRTPESDSSLGHRLDDEDDPQVSTIKITVTEAISIRSRRSLIPVRISSLPSTPRKTLTAKRHHTSAPNLFHANSSKIPLRRPAIMHEAVQEKPGKLTTKPRILKHSRGEDALSPVPIHNEIEVFHNLTRSPERTAKTAGEPKDESTTDFNSFTVYEQQEVPKSPREEVPSTVTVKQEESVADKQLEAIETKKQPAFQQSLSSLTSEDEIWAKSDALESLVKMLKEPGACNNLEAGPAALLLEALFACHHRDRLHNLADEALTTLIEGLRVDVLEQCLPRLAVTVCKMGASSGVRCALVLMKKLPPKRVQLEIVSKGAGHRTREGALQILMSCARLYPRPDVEASMIARFAVSALRDRRRRVRHAALETLAGVASLTSIREVLDVAEESVVRETSRDAEAERILQVVRIRLSRKQLPTVDVDGSVRYSTPVEQIEADWLSGTAPIRGNVSSALPSSSASSSTPSINYWMHNSRHENQFNSGSTLVKQLSETREEDAFEESPKSWSLEGNHYGGKAVKGPRAGVLRPVYVLQPEENAKSLRGYRRYDRGRSFSPPKPPKSNNNDNNSYRETTGRHFVLPAVHHQDATALRPPDFRKSFSSDQLYQQPHTKPDPYSFSLSSRSSTTSTGSSTRSGFWHKEFRSAIPVPVQEAKWKIRHANGQGPSSGGPLIAKPTVRTPSKASQKDNDSISRLSLPLSRSSGSDSSGYFTPSPPDARQPPAFIKMETEERPGSGVEESAALADNSQSDKGSVGEAVSQQKEQEFLGEAVINGTSSVESIHIGSDDNNNQHNLEEAAEEEVEAKPPTKAFAVSSLEAHKKSRSVVDLPNFLPNISSARKLSNSAPPRNTDEITTDPNENIPSGSDVMDNGQQEEVVATITTTSVSVSKTKLERRFVRNGSRKSLKVSPRTLPEPTAANKSASSSKPREVLHHVLVQLENPNWETTLEGLQGLTKIARQHPDLIEHQTHQICVTLARHIRNLRSQVARVACTTASELFMSCRRSLEMELEEIACPLFQRTADTNRFLRADANAALDVMCEHLPAHRVIPVVVARGCNHQNAVVRAAAVRMLGDIVRRLGAERVFQLPKELRDKLLLAGANSLGDGNLDARSQGKALFRYLMGHPHFQRYLHEAVPQNVLRHISKGLSSIKS